jgi:hypothetical protein
MSGIDSGIDWPRTQAAILAWLRDSTGLTVSWSKQPIRPQDAKPFASLWLLGRLRKVGQDIITKAWNAEANLIDRTLTGVREFTVQAETFTDDATPTGHAMSVMAKAQTALGLPEFIKALADEGVALITSEPIADLSAIAGPDWVSRAAMDVVFRVSARIEARSVPAIANVRRRLKLRDGNDGQPIIRESDDEP